MSRHRERGFTLLELLITLSITTVGLIGLLSLHVSLARGNDGASRAGEAMQIGNATIEGLRSQRITDMVTTLTGAGTTNPPIDVTMTPSTGRGGVAYRRRVTVTVLTGVSASLWRIRVEVGWTEDGAAQGTDSGRYDHLIAVEVVRTVEEAL